MEGLEMGTVVLVSSLVLGALALPVTAIAIHQRKRRSYERRAGVRHKEKIEL
jgi:hypothetical protein